MEITKTVIYFILAGLCEIGGGYLVWLCLKEEKPVWYGIAGAIILALYGSVMTLQTASFGKSYVVYAGIFIVMALLWTWTVDNFKTAKYDIIGTAIMLIRVAVILCQEIKEIVNQRLQNICITTMYKANNFVPHN